MEEIITSRQNRNVVRLAKLADKKYRDAERAFRFDGIKLLCEARKRGIRPESIFVRASSAEELRERGKRLYGFDNILSEGEIFYLSDDLFDKVSEEKSPDGVITVAKYIDKIRKIITINNMGSNSGAFPPVGERILLLESVRDPSNVGAVVRSAAALGAERVICSADCADPYNAKTVRASMGTLFGIAMDFTDNLPLTICQLRKSGRRVFSAALDATAVSLGSFEPKPGDCAVIGNEGHGLSRETLEACTSSVFIPMTKDVESLNAAVAASLFLWELFRAGR